MQCGVVQRCLRRCRGHEAERLAPVHRGGKVRDPKHSVAGEGLVTDCLAQTRVHSVVQRHLNLSADHTCGLANRDPQ